MFIFSKMVYKKLNPILLKQKVIPTCINSPLHSFPRSYWRRSLQSGSIQGNQNHLLILRRSLSFRTINTTSTWSSNVNGRWKTIPFGLHKKNWSLVLHNINQPTLQPCRPFCPSSRTSSLPTSWLRLPRIPTSMIPSTRPLPVRILLLQIPSTHSSTTTSFASWTLCDTTTILLRGFFESLTSPSFTIPAFHSTISSFSTTKVCTIENIKIRK